MSFKLGSQTFISLASYKIAHELLDKRSAIYSSRSRSIIAGESITKGFGIAFLPYGQQWRTQHRIHAEFLNPRTSQKYRVLQDVESRQVVYDLLSSNNFSDNFHRFSSSLVFSLAYGKRMPRGDEHEVREIDQLMANVSEKMAPGKWVVDIFPVLNYLPRFLASWKSMGDRFHKRETTLFGNNVRMGEKAPSWNWTKDLERIKEAQSLSDTELVYIIGVLYEAGSETTSGTLDFFYPCLRPASREPSKGPGGNRQHRWTRSTAHIRRYPNLLYVNVFLMEVMRWRPLAPLGLPHSVASAGV